jgi:aldehyde dehydrogenase (NAD+)
VSTEAIPGILAAQRAFFEQGSTRSLAFRLKQLKVLYRLLTVHEQEICDAVYADFHKPAFEVFGTDIALVKEEILFFLRRLPGLMRPRQVKSSVPSLPARSTIYQEPYGISLIVGTWNYPVMLLLAPLTGAMAAGNCAVLKPSELAPATSGLLQRLISAHFPPEYLAVVEGGAAATQTIIRNRPDYIFFTGSPRVGSLVMQEAAQLLIPVTLELGGKSPCIVDGDADPDLAALRVAWGKFLNGGQSCVAPDYLLLHRAISDRFLEAFRKRVAQFYGPDPSQSPDYCRIIDPVHTRRIAKLMEGHRVLMGGESDTEKRFMAPTLIDEVGWNDPVMQEEIFGPLLPVIYFDDLGEVMRKIAARPRPLALYYFSSDRRTQERVMRELSFGGGCINDTMFQYGNPALPLGGIGHSGMGRYHGPHSFHTFSHQKSVVKKATWIDIPFRYPPYAGKLKWLKLIFRI